MSLPIRSSTRTPDSEDRLNPATRDFPSARRRESALLIGLKPLRWKIVMLIDQCVGTNMGKGSKTRGV